MKKNITSPVVGAGLLALFVTTVASANVCVFTPLDPVNGGVGTRVSSISDRGSAVAGTNLASGLLPIPNGEPFYWKEHHGLSLLGLLPGAVSGTGDLVSGDGAVVVGRDYFPNGRAYTSRAFRWTKAEGLTAVPLLPGGNNNNVAGISYDGAVMVGSSEASAGFQAFRWTAATGPVGLGFLPGKTYSVGQGISDDGTVLVGQSGLAGPGIEGFRWTEQGGMTGIGFLPGKTEDDDLSVSGDGNVIIGTTYGSDGLNGEAFRWTQATGIVGLGFLPGENHSQATLVSADGSVIAGNAQVTPVFPAGRQAFRWTQSGGMVGLGFLPGGGNYSIALGMSADGKKIAGASDAPNTQLEAYLWTETEGMRSVRDILVNDYDVDLTGWSLLTALISADGKTLTGWGINPAGQEEAWVADLSHKPKHQKNAKSTPVAPPKVVTTVKTKNATR
ncbi:MAG: PEP-CTERM sorting domain-containing protein [Verrucomicrobia bacterium]|nr:PEP-CTERM sorting domain-containing protein [Verrucomicrobiota bacterium]